MALPLTYLERSALGRQQRKHMRRADHAGWQPKPAAPTRSSSSPTPCAAASPRSIPIKYDRMACSPFGFFRGAVPVMAYDLSLGPNTGIHTQLCGDAHVRNLGAFAAPDGRLVFDINDFDETIRGPFEWDVKRMATSLILAGREAGAKNAHCRDAAPPSSPATAARCTPSRACPCSSSPATMVHRLRRPSSPSPQILAARRARHPAAQPARPSPTIPASPNAPAQTSPHRNLRAAAAHRSPARISRDLQIHPPDLTRVNGAEAARDVLDSLATYAESLQPERRHFLAQYTPLDVAFKIVGTGSVGLRDYCIYMQGNGAKDPLFLQIKEEARLRLRALPRRADSSRAHQGRRVVDGQRAMQFQSDPFLGWTTIEGRDYLVRQLNDHKASVDTRRSSNPPACSNTPPSAARRSPAATPAPATPAMLAGYIGTSDRFDEAIAQIRRRLRQPDRPRLEAVRPRSQAQRQPKARS